MSRRVDKREMAATAAGLLGMEAYGACMLGTADYTALWLTAVIGGGLILSAPLFAGMIFYWKMRERRNGRKSR